MHFLLSSENEFLHAAERKGMTSFMDFVYISFEVDWLVV